MMTSYNTKSISTNGLLVYLDATNPKSYPGFRTVWRFVANLVYKYKVND